MKLHIYGMLREYKNAVRLHMPGHKANGRLFPLLKNLSDDVTELSFSDCLESPNGVIAAAQEDVAQILGAAKSYFLTDGSSCGVYAMLYTARRRGGKVIVARNSHKSVYNACAVLGIEPVILKNNERDGILLQPCAVDVESAIKKEKDVCAVLLTSPDYYGNIADYAAVRRVCDRYGKILLVDGAHGAYLRFDPDASAAYAGSAADMWVDGSHKTMPTFTQGAILNVRRSDLCEDAEAALDLFRTTSPSYPIMASIEYGVKFMQESGAPLLDALKTALLQMKMRLQKRGILFYDASRTAVLAVDFGGMGISSSLAREEFERRRIYAEMDDGRYLLFYFSAGTPLSSLRKMEGALRQIVRIRTLKNTYMPRGALACGVKKFGYLTARSLAYERVPLARAAGRIAARNIGVTPPCYPVAVAGEQITEEAAEALMRAEHTFGTEGGTVAVLNIGGRS